MSRLVTAQVRTVLHEGPGSRPIEAVPDLRERSARRDPRLAELASFEAAGSPLPEYAQVLNMRTDPANKVAAELLSGCTA
jgi:hypothetical protein